MAVLDFPAAPTVGQVATLTNGFSYQWDGAVWTLTPASPGQVAGGDLTGTYPNPTIDALKVTTAKLSVGASAPNAGQADLSTFLNVTSGTEVVVLTISNFTTRGARMLFIVNVTGMMNAPTASAQSLLLRGYYGSTQCWQQKYDAILPAGALNGWLSMNYGYTAVISPPAGTYTFQLRALRYQGDATFQLTQGTIILMEFA